MSVLLSRRAIAAALIAALAGTALGFSRTRGGPDDYTFELVEREVKQGGGATITVRLVDTRTGKVVPDAVLFTSRLDMSPDGMTEMSASLEQAADMLPGYYRFVTDLTMQGG